MSAIEARCFILNKSRKGERERERDRTLMSACGQMANMFLEKAGAVYRRNLQVA